MNRQTFIYCFLILFSFSSTMQNGLKTDLKKVYFCQKKYIDRNAKGIPAYSSILSFAELQRLKLYKNIGLQIDSSAYLYILEGFSPWGTLQGLVWSNNFAYAYTTGSSNVNVTFKKVNINSQSEDVLGINPTIVSLIKEWKVEEISLQKKGLIAVRTRKDGYYFLATRVRKQRDLKIDIIDFKDFDY